MSIIAESRSRPQAARALKVPIAILLFLLVSSGCSSEIDTADSGASVSRPKEATIDAAAKGTPVGPVSDALALPSESPKASSKNQMELAIKAATNSQFDVAIQHLKTLLITDQENSKAIFLLARCHAGNGDLADAIEMLESIRSDDAEFGIPAMGQRAEYLSTLGRLDESIPLWETLLRKRPDLLQIRSSLSIDLYRQGRRIESANQLQQLAIRGAASEDELRRLLNVTDPPPSRKELAIQARQKKDIARETVEDSDATLNQVWAAIKERRYRQAFDISGRVAAGGESPAVQLQAGVLQVWLASELMDFEKALAILQGLPENASLFPSYWLAIGAIHESKSDLDLSIAAYHRAMKMDSTRDVTHDRLSAALLKRGKVSEAQRVDERRFALAGPAEAVLAIGAGQPDDLAACRAMIDDLEQLGRFDQAASWLLKVAPRHALEFGGQKKVEERIASMRAVSLSEREQIWSGGIGIDSLSDPSLEFESTESNVVLDSDPDDIPDADGEIRFEEASQTLSLDFAYRNAMPPKSRLLRLFEQLGGGIAAIDYDRDGDADLFFSQAGGSPPLEGSSESNALFRNDGGELTEVGPFAGTADVAYSLGATYADWNQDGHWDLLIANFGTNQLLINQGDGTFVDRSDWVLEPNNHDTFGRMTASLAVADLDGDALPDLVEVNYVDDPAVFQPIPVTSNGFPAVYVGPNKFRSGIDRVGFGGLDGSTELQPLAVQSDGKTILQDDGTTTDQGKVPKLGDAAQPGLGLMIVDLDGTPGLECFVANDARPNQCWKVTRNESGTRVISERSTVMGLATSGQGKSTACMGIAAGDFDRNGLPDLVVTNWYDEWLNLYQQSLPGAFVDQAPRFGLDQFSDRHVGFGVVAEDFDNDRWTDLVIGNGHVDDFSNQGIPQKMPTQVLRNLGGQFAEMKQSHAYFAAGHLSRCLVAADLDRDGLLDVVTTDLTDQSAVLMNSSDSEHHWVQLELVATTAERSAVGAKVSIVGAKPRLRQHVLASAGYMGRSEHALQFGLGDRNGSVEIQVDWVDGLSERYQDVPIDRRSVLVQGQANTLEL